MKPKEWPHDHICMHDELWYAETFSHESCWLQACYHCKGCLIRAISVALWFQASYNVSFHGLIEEESKQDVAILALWHSSIVFDERCRSTCSVGLTFCWGSALWYIPWHTCFTLSYGSDWWLAPKYSWMLALCLFVNSLDWTLVWLAPGGAQNSKFVCFCVLSKI